MLLAPRLALVAGLLIAHASFASATAAPDAQLGPLLERVIDTHPSAVAARAEEAAAVAELSGSRWARFPSMAIETFADPRSGGSHSTALTAEQPLWTGGRISASITQSRGQLDSAVAARDEVYLDLSLRTVQAYVELQRLERRARIFEESVAEHRKLVDSMLRRVEQEISAASDLKLAESRMRQAEIEVLQTRAGAQVALLQLKELTGDQDLRIAIGPLPNEGRHLAEISELLQAGLRFDPQRRRLEAEVQIASAEVKIRKSELLPQIGARYVHHLANDDDLDDEVGFVVRFQTDGGLSRVSAISAARQRERAAQSAVTTASREHRERLMAQYTEYAAAEQRAEVGREAALAAQAVTDSFLRQFAAGRRTWPEVLNSVRETITARLSQVDAEGGAALSYLNLQLLSGAWQPGAEESGS